MHPVYTDVKKASKSKVNRFNSKFVKTVSSRTVNHVTYFQSNRGVLKTLKVYKKVVVGIKSNVTFCSTHIPSLGPFHTHTIFIFHRKKLLKPIFFQGKL